VGQGRGSRRWSWLGQSLDLATDFGRDANQSVRGRMVAPQEIEVVVVVSSWVARVVAQVEQESDLVSIARWHAEVGLPPAIDQWEHCPSIDRAGIAEWLIVAGPRRINAQMECGSLTDPVWTFQRHAGVAHLLADDQPEYDSLNDRVWIAQGRIGVFSLSVH